MSTSRWTDRELPILESVAAAERATGGPRWEDVVEATGLTGDQVQIGLRNLYQNGYLRAIDVTSMSGGFELLDIQLLEPGLRAAGVWPNDPYEEFVRTMQLAIAREADPERKGVLERLLTASREVGQSVITGVLTDFIKRTVGLA